MVKKSDVLLNNCDHMAQGHPGCMGSLKYIRQESHWSPSSATLGFPTYRLAKQL